MSYRQGAVFNTAWFVEPRGIQIKIKEITMTDVVCKTVTPDIRGNFYDIPFRKKGLKRKVAGKLMELISKSPMGMAEFAARETEFYRCLYHGLMGRRGTLKAASFVDLPLVTKSAVSRAVPLDMLAQSQADRVFKYAETTGSSGMPTPSFYTHKEFAGSVKLARMTPFTSSLREVTGSNRRAVCGLACGFTIAGSSFQNILDSLGFMTCNVDARTTIAPPERIARLLCRYLPSVIAASETDFLAWMRVVKEDFPDDYERVVENLRVLVSTAELCSNSRSAAISREFDIIHIDTYACVEGFFSVPCPCGEKHVLPIYKVEVMDESLKKSSDTGTGRFVFTNLFRKSTPFVRYLLDDLVTISESSCPYGFTRSVKPWGRFETSVEILGKRYGVAHFEEELFTDNLFGEYRVVIHDDRGCCYSGIVWRGPCPGTVYCRPAPEKVRPSCTF
jgi:phenylacetate-CoA ligase